MDDTGEVKFLQGLRDFCAGQWIIYENPEPSSFCSEQDLNNWSIVQAHRNGEGFEAFVQFCRTSTREFHESVNRLKMVQTKSILMQFIDSKFSIGIKTIDTEAMKKSIRKKDEDSELIRNIKISVQAQIHDTGTSYGFFPNLRMTYDMLLAIGLIKISNKIQRGTGELVSYFPCLPISLFRKLFHLYEDKIPKERLNNFGIFVEFSGYSYLFFKDRDYPPIKVRGGRKSNHNLLKILKEKKVRYLFQPCDHVVAVDFDIYEASVLDELIQRRDNLSKSKRKSHRLHKDAQTFPHPENPTQTITANEYAKLKGISRPTAYARLRKSQESNTS